MDGAARGDDRAELRNKRRPDGELTFAVGDVHGHIGKLEALLGRCARFSAGAPMRLVFVGDYVDRGPDARAVIELLLDLTRHDPDDVICLRGNHEELLLGAAAGQLDMLPGRPTLSSWLGGNGAGAATLVSYGVERASDLPPQHLAWMAMLPARYDDGRRLFVHAGVRPGCALEHQVEEDLVWIREPFLSHDGSFGRLVVHGHTPVAARRPDLRANRLNLDSGAGYDGPLTAAVFDDHQRDPIAFLNDRGEMRPLDVAGMSL
jgi:serine/threonine protein phosphatase 1